MFQVLNPCMHGAAVFRYQVPDRLGNEIRVLTDLPAAGQSLGMYSNLVHVLLNGSPTYEDVAVGQSQVENEQESVLRQRSLSSCMWVSSVSSYTSFYSFQVMRQSILV